MPSGRPGRPVSSATSATATQGAVLLESGMPHLLRQVADRLADRFSGGPADGEAGADPARAQVADVGQEAFTDPVLSVRMRMSVQ